MLLEARALTVPCGASESRKLQGLGRAFTEYGLPLGWVSQKAGSEAEIYTGRVPRRQCRQKHRWERCGQQALQREKLSCEASAAATGPQSCRGPWAPLGTGAGCPGGGRTLREAAGFEEETVSQQSGRERLRPRGRWRACPAVGPLPRSCRDTC